MKQKNVVLFFAALLFIAFVFTACGGGGGNNLPPVIPSVPYSGINTPAYITSENAVHLATDAYYGWSQIESSDGAEPMSVDSPNDLDSMDPLKNNILLARLVKQTATEHLNAFVSGNAVPLGVWGILDGFDGKNYGECDGYTEMKGSVKDNGNFSMNITYWDYSDDCVLYISGRTNVSGIKDPYSYNYKYITTTYEALEFASGGTSITQSGTWFTEYLYPTCENCIVEETANIVTRDDASSKTYWMKDYKTRSFEKHSGDPKHYDLNITGRYYDPDHGSVDIATEQHLVIRSNESYPYEGVLTISGDSNTRARWEIISTAAYQVTGDTDGDDEFDDYDSGSVHWPGENHPPVVHTSVNQWEVPGCQVILNGTGSRDTDLDVLTYDWSILSSPDGSTATLSAPNSANPSFTPTLVGDYIMQLVVSDGFEDSPPDTVTVFIRPGTSCGDVDTPPIARILANNKSVTGCLVTLDGSSSSDYDEDPLTYAWSFASIPGSSGAVLRNPNSPAAYFTTDVAGDYTIELVVNDGLVGSKADSLTVDVARGYFCEQQIAIAPINRPVLSFALTLGEINGDGRPDIAVPTGEWEDGVGLTTQLLVYTQNTDGQFGPPTAYPAETTYDGWGSRNSVDMGDLNSDGRTDIVMPMHNGVGVFEQNVSGGFNTVLTHPVSYRVNSKPSLVRIADLNNDGRQDIVSTTWGTDANEIDLFYQDTQGTFSTRAIYSAGKDNKDLVVDDINSDGMNDIILVPYNFISGEIVILKQNAGGTFDGPFNYDLIIDEINDDLVTGIAVGDMNSDGRKDIVASVFNQNSSSPFIAIYYQNTSSTLDSPIFYPSGESYCAIEIADMNIDGKLDVISACGGGTVKIFLQQSAGSFASFTTPPFLPNHNSIGRHAIAVDDIDGDGFNDVAIMQKDNVRLLYNNGLLE